MDLGLENEADLIEKARSDPEAFIILYEHYLPHLYRYAYYRTGSKQEAEDAVSQTFLQAMENLAGFRFRGVPFGHWLYRIAGNIISRSYERSSRENRILEEWHDSGAEITVEQVDLLRYLHELPEAQQQVLTLRYIQDLSIRQVARVMNRSEGAVKQLALRGLRALRERMDDRAR